MVKFANATLSPISDIQFAQSVEKLHYVAMCYDVVPIEMPTFEGTKTFYLPNFFEAFNPEKRYHLKGKWEASFERFGNRGAFMDFLSELDGTNKWHLNLWINSHVVCEGQPTQYPQRLPKI